SIWDRGKLSLLNESTCCQRTSVFCTTRLRDWQPGKARSTRMEIKTEALRITMVLIGLRISNNRITNITGIALQRPKTMPAGRSLPIFGKRRFSEITSLKLLCMRQGSQFHCKQFDVM